LGAGAVVVSYVLLAVFVPYATFWFPPALVAGIAVALMLRRRGARRAETAPTDLQGRTTTEIGEAWMLTSLLLRQGPSRSDRLHLCRVRDAYLEELSLRDPDGFQQWVEDSLSGKRCRPDTYIRRETRNEPEAAQWRRMLRHHLARTTALRRPWRPSGSGRSR
jgi:hypothetical protein